MRFTLVFGERLMPITAEEFERGSIGQSEIEQLLKSDPSKAWTLHEIEEAIIGTEMNRRKHLDIFIANLTMLTPLLFRDEQIVCRVVGGVPYFKWQDTVPPH